MSIHEYPATCELQNDEARSIGEVYVSRKGLCDRSLVARGVYQNDVMLLISRTWLVVAI
jgi:hypothetical protein